VLIEPVGWPWAPLPGGPPRRPRHGRPGDGQGTRMAARHAPWLPGWLPLGHRW